MKKPFFSVIIPVYNCAKYLEKCLQSILEQTFGNIELICLDDGSSDNSLQIVEEAAAKDVRIQVICDGKNVGPGARRNQGIALAKGEYILMVDGDDWIEPDTCEQLYAGVKRCDCDVVSFNVYYDCPQSMKKVKFYNVRQEFCGDWRDIEELLFNSGFQSWHCMYRKSFLTSQKIQYPPYYICEDVPFVLKSLLSARKILFMPQHFYHYVQHQQSLVHATSDKFMSIFDVIADVKRLMQQANVAKHTEEKFLKWSIHHILVFSDKVDMHLRPKYKQQAQEVAPLIKLKNMFCTLKMNICTIPFLKIFQPDAENTEYRILGMKFLSVKMRGNKTKIYFWGVPLIKIIRNH